VLSAPDAPARARISTIGTAGPLGAGSVVAVPSGRSAEVKLTVPRAARGGFAIVITPLAGSGPVYAGRVLATRAGGVQLLTPVVSAPASVPLPAVTGSVTAVMP
jgi:hypothetical protein